MKNTFAKSIYQARYQSQLSFDQFLAYLNRGTKLLKRSHPNHMNHDDTLAMDIALEYNMEVVMQQVTASHEYF